MTTRVYIGDRTTRRLSIRAIIHEAAALGVKLQSTPGYDRSPEPFFIDFPDAEMAVVFKLTHLGH